MISISILFVNFWERVKKGDFFVTLTLEILTYARVCCGFARFASLEIPLFIRVPIVAPNPISFSFAGRRTLFSIYFLGHSDGDAQCGWQTEDH